MEKMISELNGKLKTLSFRTKKTDKIIARGDKASIANITEAVSTQKESIEEKKFSKGESEEEVSVWGAKGEELLAEADECTRKIAKHLKSMIAAAQDAEALEAHTKAMSWSMRKCSWIKSQKLNQEQAAAKKAPAGQLEFQKQKMKLELEHQKQISSLKVLREREYIRRMSKLVTCKFEGTPQDWVRFSGQFSS